MLINTDIDLRARKKFSLKEFRGLDTLSTAVDVSAKHASNMENLIVRDGNNHKRNGWATQYRVRDGNTFPSIKGIFSFTIYNISFLLAFAGCKFWHINRESGEATNITNKRIKDDGTFEATPGDTSVSVVGNLSDEECKCFLNGNKAYFVGCGDYLVFSKWENGYFELRRVVDNEDVYIPTTTENIGSQEDGETYTRVTAEEANILSPYTINTLFGRETMTYTDETTFDKATYYLDKKNFEDIEVTVNQKNGWSTTLTKDTSGGALYEVNDDIGVFRVEEKTFIETVDNVKVLALPFQQNLNIGLISLFGEKEILTLSGGTILYKSLHFDDVPVTNLVTVDGCTVAYSIYQNTNVGLIYRKNGDADTILYPPLQLKNIVISDFSITIERSRWEATISYKKTYTFASMQGNISTENEIISSIENSFSILDPSSYVIKDEAEKLTGTVDPNAGVLRLYAQKVLVDGVYEQGDVNIYEPLSATTPNITVKMKGTTNNVVSTSKIACKFGTQGTPDRLFVATPKGNVIYWSKDEDFTYFGEKSWCVCGTAEKQIKGMDRLNDKSLLVVKEYSIQEPSIYVVSGGLKTGENEDEKTKYTAIFSPSGFQVGMGAVGEVNNFNGDCLMVAKDGLYAVSLGENMTVDARYILHRSKQISNTLEKYDLSTAKCITYNGKFLIAIGGEENQCFVADNKYLTDTQNDNETVYDYEWWKWTNIPVCVWGYVDNELWFGTRDGQLCKFIDNSFEDVTKTELTNGLITYTADEDEIQNFSINENIAVETGDTFTFISDIYAKITTSNFEVVGETTRFYVPLKDFTDKEIIYIDNTEYEIIVPKEGLFFYINNVLSGEEVTFEKNIKNKELYVCKNNDSDITFKFNKDDEEEISFGTSRNSVDGLNAKLKHKETVIAKWYTGALDLGARDYLKALTFLTLTGEKDLANHLMIGFRTRLTHLDYELLRANNDVEINKLSLNTLSLDDEFGSSFSKRLNVKNVNFLMLYFISNTAEDMSINSVEVEYKIYKRNIGVK